MDHLAGQRFAPAPPSSRPPATGGTSGGRARSPRARRQERRPEAGGTEADGGLRALEPPPQLVQGGGASVPVLNDARDLLLERGHGPGRAGRDRLPARRTSVERLAAAAASANRAHRRGRAGSHTSAARRAPRAVLVEIAAPSAAYGQRTVVPTSRSPNSQSESAIGFVPRRATTWRCGAWRSATTYIAFESNTPAAHGSSPGPRRAPAPLTGASVLSPSETARRTMHSCGAAPAGVLEPAIGKPGQGQHDLIGRERHGRLLATTATSRLTSTPNVRLPAAAGPRRSERVTPPRRARGSGARRPRPGRPGPPPAPPGRGRGSGARDRSAGARGAAPPACGSRWSGGGWTR